MRELEHSRPADIEAESFRIIGAELEERGIVLPADQAPLVKRAIHTTADFDYARNLVFTPGAVEAGVRALRAGTPILTDTNMARSGINRGALERLGISVHCFMADPEVARRAAEAGTTRAAAAVDQGAALWPEGIYAVGNAPTALIRMAQLIRAGAMSPALILAVPVGFVNVVESKEEILALARERGIPAIAALGRKGGSTVAAALCNALLYQSGGKDRLIGAALCLLLLFGAGCSPAPGADQETLDRELDVQLGLLAEVITQEERSAAMDLWMRLRPVRQARLDRGEYRRGDREQELLEELNGLYEAYTIRYLGGDDLGWGYTDPEEHVLARYRIGGAGELTLMPTSLDLTHGPWTREDLEEMWESMQAVLPKDAFRDFRSYVPFTDGEGETVAYVLPADPGGSQWEICLDPADMGDRDYFLETVLHEYCHYLTLNHRQADYRGEPTVETYCEAGMVSREGSYLDDFCQRFWTGYLDDRLADLDSYNFFLRHEEDFVSSYASTDPSEDISESFAFFVLWDVPESEAVWAEKLRFFLDYPELTEFRRQVRENLGLEQPEQAA